MNTTKHVLAGVFLGIALCLLVWFGNRVIYPDPRGALPLFTHQEISIVQATGPTGDGSYHLRARVSRDGFNRFVKKMGFENAYDARVDKYVKPSKDSSWQEWVRYTNGILEYYTASN